MSESHDEPLPSDASDGESSQAPDGPEPGLIPPEVLERIPPQQRQLIERFEAIAAYGPMRNPVLRQVRPEHVTTILANQAREMEIESQDRRDARRVYGWVGLALAVITVGAILVLALTGNQAIVESLLPFFTGLVAGGLGGFGFSEARHSRRG